MGTTRRALLIDLDGVVRIWDAGNDAHAESEAGLPAGAIRRAAFAPRLLEPAITGAMSDEVWRRLVADRLRIQHPEADAALAVRLWSESCGRADPAVLEIIAAWRGKGPVVLVTNATTRLPADLSRLGLARAFDAVVNSSEVGVAKPQSPIYVEALRRARVAPAEALFVDDSPPKAAAAEGLGMDGHVYRGVEGLRRAWGRTRAKSGRRMEASTAGGGQGPR